MKKMKEIKKRDFVKEAEEHKKEMKKIKKKYSDDEELYADILEFVMSKDVINMSMLQRRFRLRCGDAMKMMKRLEKSKAIGPQVGYFPREVLKMKEK